jgi:hypothetical protein
MQPGAAVRPNAAPTLGGQLLAVSPSLALIAGAALAAAAIVLLRAFEQALSDRRPLDPAARPPSVRQNAGDE